MSKVMLSESYLEDIADAIRTKNGSSDTYKPAEMADAIEDIPGGITPSTGTKQISITSNGTTTEDVTNYASAEITVNVSGGDSESVTGTFSVENDTKSAVTITTLTEIGFKPSIFIMYEATKQTESTTQYGICVACRLQIGGFYIRAYERYSNTGGSVAAGSVPTDWTVSQGGYLHLSGDNIDYVASNTCILLGGVTYNWIAIP